MAENSNISWTDHTLNPWIGCTRVSPACDNCYAARLMEDRMHVVKWGAGQPRKRTKPATWNMAHKWEREAIKSGKRPRVFCASLADVFDNEVPDEWRVDLWALIEATPHLDWLLLTKRIGNAKSMLPWAWVVEKNFPKNVRIGATVVTQEEADRDVPKLLELRMPNFLSIEPMLGPIDLEAWTLECCGNIEYVDMGCYGSRPECCSEPVPKNALDWVIVGGESGPGARAARGSWVRSLRDQCARGDVPFHFKQWGEWSAPGFSIDDATGERTDPDDAAIFKVGTKAAGRLLDGVEHNGFPA